MTDAEKLEHLRDLWTRAVVEMEGCPMPTEACQAIGCEWDVHCIFDRYLASEKS